MSTIAQSRPVAAHASTGSSLVQLAVERLRRWRRDLQLRVACDATRRELQQLTDRELADLGLTRWDIDRAARAAVYGR